MRCIKFLKKLFIFTVIATMVLSFSVIYDTSVRAENVQVLTADQFVSCLYKALNRKTAYNNEYPYNLGYYDGETITWDCWNLGKSIIWTKGAIVDNYTSGTYARIDTSCGLGDWTGLTIIKKAPNCNSDFTNLIPGEWLYLDGHMGYYVGDGQVIECTAGWNAWCVTQSQIDSNGNRTKDGISNGKWLYHGMVPWIDYSAYEYLTPSNDPIGEFESCTSEDGSIDIKGWMYDPDKPSEFIPFNVYIGGLPGSQEAEVHTGYFSDLLRTDVNDNYGITGNHGYYTRIYTDKRGMQTVYICALNIYGGGEDAVIGQKKINIVEKQTCLHTNTVVSGAIPSSCTGSGYSGDTYCSDCGEIVSTGVELPALEHSYYSVVTPPTNNAQGYTTHICAFCGYNFIDSFTDCIVESTSQIVFSSVSAKPGETVKIKGSLKNCGKLTSVAVSNIIYNTSALSLVSVEWLAKDPTMKSWNNNTAKGIISYSEEQDLNGDIIELTFTVNDEAAEGDYQVAFTCKTANNSEPEEIAAVPGTVTVKHYITGDLNGDGIVTDQDAIYLLFHTFFADEYPVNQPCDFNKDGKETDQDAIYLLFHVFFKDEYPV